ncbi:MAG: Holliday junction branch migration protein RuvA [Acidimicrobiia bacterium]|nr:Holliday junction branch migration protein RuvA [Acidimicrobiia bacterium]
MISRLRGTIVSLGLESVVVDVHGVGYRVGVTTRTIAELPTLGSEVVLHTHTHVREDQLALFGFPTERELDTFTVLLGASGIGPKVALAVLSTLSPDELAEAMLNEDLGALSSVPGIGNRTAQKIVLELKPRFAAVGSGVVGGGSDRGKVREALEGLGYQPAEITEALTLVDAGLGVEEQLRDALRTLGKGRLR